MGDQTKSNRFDDRVITTRMKFGTTIPYDDSSMQTSHLLYNIALNIFVKTGELTAKACEPENVTTAMCVTTLITH